MSKNLLIISLFVMTLVSTVRSQSIAYEYDQAGNRIARRVITVGSSQIKRQTDIADSTVVKDVLGKQTVIIYPNPTRGMLGVEITGVDTEEITITVFNGQGVTIYTMKGKNGINYINFTNYVNGWYILSIQTGTKRKEYKIIKE